MTINPMSLMNMEMMLYGGVGYNHAVPSFSNGYTLQTQAFNNPYINPQYNYNPSFWGNTNFRQNIPQGYAEQTSNANNDTIFQGLNTSEANALVKTYAKNLEYSQKLLPAIGSGAAFGALMMNPRILAHPCNYITTAFKGDTIDMFKGAKSGGAVKDLWSKNHFIMEEAYAQMNRAEARHKSKLGLFRARYSDAEYNKLKGIMDKARVYLKEHQEEALSALNEQLFMETWEKYAKGILSAWEMESLCYYYHEHELANIDTRKYGISDFSKLNPDSDIEKYFKRNNKDIPIFKTYRIIGTVLNKDDTRSLITLLTTSGVVSVKFTREQYAKYKKQISEKQEDGTKKVVEKGWFKRGSLLMITGYRRDDQFVAKTYANTASHQIYQIELINNGTDMVLTHERIDTMEDNDE